MEKFNISEIFGPTIQGEGPEFGKRCCFVRFAGCDSDCVWCDTRYAWDKKAVGYGFEKMTLDEVVDRVCSCDPWCTKVVLTGGNPALYDLTELIDKFDDLGIGCSVETQGTRFRDWFNLCEWVVISPKLSNAKLTHPISAEMVRNVMFRVSAKIALKIVVFTLEDLREAVREYCQSSSRPLANEFIISTGTVLGEPALDTINRWRQIIDWYNTPEILRSGGPDVKIMCQGHVLLWGHKRGV